jgi:aminotransferase
MSEPSRRLPDAPFRPPLSSRTGHLREASLLRSLTQRVSAFADGINLGQGVCDLEMPDVLRAAAIRSLREDRATYTPFGGLEALRAEVAARMRRRYGVAYEPDEVVITIGASAALFSTYLTLVDPGDEVVLFEPFYPYHYTGALLAGARVVAIPTEPGNGAIDWERLAGAIGPRTRLVVVNTPSNPLGKVWRADELDRLADLLAGTDTIVMSDEIYEDLVYDGGEHVPPAARPGLHDRTVTVSGLSKAYSITGWRLGWLAAPRALASAIGPVFDVLCVCAPRPLQAAAATALAELPESFYRSARDAYLVRRDRLAGALRDAGLTPWVPSGAYYMMADFRERYGPIPTREACFRLLDEIHVATIPGEIFYSGESPPVVRFHFAVEEDLLEEVARRLRRGRA